jgi:copper chaperone CopZ
MGNRIILFLALFCIASQCYSDTIAVSFNTLGNCSICKDRIEGAVRPIHGVISVSWKIIGDVTTVTYYNDSTDVQTIMHVIAGVGHDTEWFPAPDSAYNLLKGTCCEYLRTNNYDHVQVGFLSLMNGWYYPLSVDEKRAASSFHIFPNPATEFIVIESPSSTSTPCNAALYTLSGNMVTSTTFTGSGSLNTASLSPGEYVVTVSTQGILTDRKKVIKR